MMEWMREWLIGIMAAALLVAVLHALLPKGGLGQIGRLAGGLIFLLTVVQPLLQIDEDIWLVEWEEYREELSQYSDELSHVEENLMETLIAEQSATYIQDKAMTMGIVCTVVVETASDDDGNPLPHEAVIWGELTLEEEEWLTDTIATDLAIPPERQTYEGGET